MELLLPLLAAVLVGTGVFLVLSRAMIRLIIGLSMIAYGANISILLVTGMGLDAPPLLEHEAPYLNPPYVDPLPQALILTAIVIGFGTTALLLVLSVRAYQATQTDHVQDLIDIPDPVRPQHIYADPEQPSISPETTQAETKAERERNLSGNRSDDHSGNSSADEAAD